VLGSSCSAQSRGPNGDIILEDDGFLWVCKISLPGLAASFGGKYTWRIGNGDDRSRIAYPGGGVGPQGWPGGRYHGMSLTEEMKFTSGERVPWATC
jgi:hypothetical protein